MTIVHPLAEAEIEIEQDEEEEADTVIVCLFGLAEHANGQPMFGCKVYGPFRASEALTKWTDIRRLEGGACLIRPLVDLDETFRRISAD